MGRAETLPSRMDNDGKLSTPLVDRICLFFTIIIFYLIHPYFSDLIKNISGEYSNIISIVTLILISPLVGNHVSLKITNYLFSR